MEGVVYKVSMRKLNYCPYFSETQLCKKISLCVRKILDPTEETSIKVAENFKVTLKGLMKRSDSYVVVLLFLTRATI